MGNEQICGINICLDPFDDGDLNRRFFFLLPSSKENKIINKLDQRTLRCSILQFRFFICAERASPLHTKAKQQNQKRK